jgi:nicotinamidase-related amidase
LQTQTFLPQSGGNMPRSALLIVDMINLLDFPEAKSLLKFAIPVAKNILNLKNKFYKKNYPVIYVNDNFEEWLADWKTVYSKCREGKGAELAKLLKPTEKDYFILKPRHSAFEATPLEILLEKLRIKKLVVTGIAGDICVLFTAHDAHARDFEVIVPSDCIASNTRDQNKTALKQLSKALRLKTTRSQSLRL